MSLGAEVAVDESRRFRDLGLDPKVLQAIRGLKWTRPTAIQATCIPLALKGKDILARSNTGTGKTAAYAIPVIERVLRERQAGNPPSITALIVVPTQDLCHQVELAFNQLLKHLRGRVRAAAILSTQSVQTRMPIIKSKPDVLISTPHTLFQHLQSNTLDLSKLTSFVIDEADVVLMESSEIGSVRTYIPLTCQMYMLSATLTKDVMELKKRLLNAPFVVKLDGAEDDDYTIEQTYIQCIDIKRYLALYGLLRTGEINGKTLIFVNSIDNGFKLQIMLEMFKFKVAVLNSEVPENSRNHIVRSFNEGSIQHLIATDESLQLDDLARRTAEMRAGKDGDTNMEDDGGSKGKKRKRSKEDEDADDAEEDVQAVKKSRIHMKALKVIEKSSQKEYGVHRGVDFQGVAWVINFDASATPEQYTHRIGRTGRAGRQGRALSFYLPDESVALHAVIADQEERGKAVAPHATPPEAFVKLQLRVSDVLGGITRKVLAKARSREIAREILNSEKLKAHFSADPLDLRRLNHIANNRPKSMTHSADYIWDVPKYMGLDVKSAVDQHHEENLLKAQEKRKKLITTKNKALDPLSGFSLEKARKVEEKLNAVELQLMDPDSLKRRSKDNKDARKVREWIKKYGKKTGRHGQRVKIGAKKPGRTM
eukprot:TRINITY_DN6067_c0_g1_i1.p1 TRINITY_DN6067_c0_g1~~TRINITY_DN6067_c0_g1_i1.p1  ORF type:complete len:653 (+),score=168.64 TRINITY_DN6067_c0_g1_i1:58-2016(+)